MLNDIGPFLDAVTDIGDVARLPHLVRLRLPLPYLPFVSCPLFGTIVDAPLAAWLAGWPSVALPDAVMTGSSL